MKITIWVLYVALIIVIPALFFVMLLALHTQPKAPEPIKVEIVKPTEPEVMLDGECNPEHIAYLICLDHVENMEELK